LVVVEYRKGSSHVYRTSTKQKGRHFCPVWIHNAGLTPKQWAITMVFMRAPRISLRRIAEEVGYARKTVVRAVVTMMRRWLLKRYSQAGKASRYVLQKPGNSYAPWACRGGDIQARVKRPSGLSKEIPATINRQKAAEFFRAFRQQLEAPPPITS